MNWKKKEENPKDTININDYFHNSALIQWNNNNNNNRSLNHDKFMENNAIQPNPKDGIKPCSEDSDIPNPEHAFQIIMNTKSNNNDHDYFSNNEDNIHENEQFITVFYNVT